MLLTFLDEVTYLLENYKLTMFLFTFFNIFIWEIVDVICSKTFDKILFRCFKSGGEKSDFK